MASKIKIIFAAALTLFLSLSCTKEGETGGKEPSAISFSLSSVKFDVSGGTKNIFVTTSLSCTAESDSPSWLSAVLSENGKTLTVEASVNNGAARSGIVSVRAESATARLAVSQAAYSSAEVSLLSAGWEISDADASSNSLSWILNNNYPANLGDGKGVAYISTEGADVARSLRSQTVSGSHLAENDSFVFCWPGVSVAVGSTVDFMCSIFSRSDLAPKYWIFEYLEGGEWKSVAQDLRPAAEDPSLMYSFKLFSDASQYVSFSQSFTVGRPLEAADLKMRLRAVGKYNTSGGVLSAASGEYVSFANTPWTACTVNIYRGIPVKDSRNVLVLGNSFTYYYGTAFCLKEIARSQGHDMHLHPFSKASQYLSDHRTLELSLEQTTLGGYDCAFLQDQSGQHSRYASDPESNSSVLTQTRNLINLIKQYSPSVNIFLENTWAFAASTYGGYGSYESFDSLLQSGAKAVADATGSTVSPIGAAFQKAREQGVTDLYYTDSKHPSHSGAYLKACVNYLMIYGTAFDSNASDCGLSADAAAKLRSIAEQVVLK